MSQNNSTENSGVSLPGWLVTVAQAIWESLSLKLVFVGVGFVLAGYFAGGSIWAGLFPLWGAGMIILGSFLYTAIWYSRRPSGE